MPLKIESRGGDALGIDIPLIIRTIQFYFVIGVGFGLLAIILLLQFAGGEGISGGIITGVILIIILSFAVLSGPLIAAFVGYATAGRGSYDIGQRCINSSTADAIGFAVFGIVVSVIILIGFSVVIDGGGASSGSPSDSAPIKLGKFITLTTLMIIPN
jgi:hypothetical protein